VRPRLFAFVRGLRGWAYVQLHAFLHWTTFLSAVILLNLSPSPDIAFILSQSARRGHRIGFAGLFGIWSGAFVHVVMAAAGLSAILATSAEAFTVVKWTGGLYLIWLGIQALRSQGRGFTPEQGGQTAGAGAVYRQGVLVAALNPKVAR
jgi:threonine/homoserine/homoserine lactone efflux protein